MKPQENSFDQNEHCPSPARPGEIFARWLAGIPDRSRSATFKDVLDNVKNLGALIAMSMVFAVFVQERVLPEFIVYPVSLILVILLAMIVLQSAAIFLLSSGDSSGTGLSNFVNALTLSVVLVVTLCGSLTIYKLTAAISQ